MVLGAKREKANRSEPVWIRSQTYFWISPRTILEFITSKGSGDFLQESQTKERDHLTPVKDQDTCTLSFPGM